MNGDNSEKIQDLEDKIEELESRLDWDVDDSMQDIYHKIDRLRDDLSIWNSLLEKSIPYTYEKLLCTSSIHLKECNFHKAIAAFNKLEKTYYDVPHPINKKRFDNKKWRKQHILKNTNFLKNSKQFSDLAYSSSIDAEPILQYYSIAYLFSFHSSLMIW